MSRAGATAGRRGTAQTDPAPAPMFTSVPTGIRATTRRVRGSTRSTASLLVSLSQTEPKATWPVRPTPSATATLATTRGPGADRALSVSDNDETTVAATATTAPRRAAAAA